MRYWEIIVACFGLAFAGCSVSSSGSGGTGAGLAGGGSSGSMPGAGGSANGTITPIWAAFCTAVFTSDYALSDRFGEASFTASEGAAYLVGGFDEGNEMVTLTILYLVDGNTVEFEIEAPSLDELPMTLSCAPDEAVSGRGVFQESSFFLDETLTEPACTLEEGTFGPGGGGYALASPGMSGAPSIYRVQMGGLTEACDGHSTTYLAVEPFLAFDAQKVRPPIAQILQAE